MIQTISQKPASSLLKLSILLCSTALLPGISAGGPAAEAGERPLAVLLGDSIRIGYQKAAEGKLTGKAKVWAPEENCEDSKFMLAHLDKWLEGRKPAVIHINCGLHDIFLNEREEPRRSVESYAENLRKIFARIKELNSGAVVIFALTTPVDEARQRTSKTYGRLVRRNADVDAINAKAAEVASECGVLIDDLHAPVLEKGAEAMLVDDGIHLNAKAAELLGGRVAAAVEDALKSKSPETKAK